MNLDILFSHATEHAELVSKGISPSQSFNIILGNEDAYHNNTPLSDDDKTFLNNLELEFQDKVLRRTSHV